MKQFILGITGATGSIYGIRLMEELLQRDYHVFLTITRAGQQVIETEVGIPLRDRSTEKQLAELIAHLSRRQGQRNANKNTEMLSLKMEEDFFRERLHLLPIDEIGACIASGSFLTEGMAVVPCSMSTLSGIAHGRSSNLLERAADVMLKEGRPLLIAPREMPLNTIHLENMLALSKMGVVIAPPMPGFYHQPETIDDLVEFVIGKMLDRLKIPNTLFKRWEG